MLSMRIHFECTQSPMTAMLMEVILRSVVFTHVLYSVAYYRFGGASELTSIEEVNNTQSLIVVKDGLHNKQPLPDDNSVILSSLGERVVGASPGYCQAITLRDVLCCGLRVSQLYLAASSTNVHLLLQRMTPANVTNHIRCIPRPMPVEVPRVEIVNGSQLLERLGSRNESTRGRCAVVLFYAPWCVFCARVAPHFNALARAFPLLPIFAIDAMHFSNSNYRFGTVAVPNMLVFHNSKAIARFNHSVKILENMVAFLSNVTGLQANLSVGLLPSDYIGPLRSTPTDERDLLLWAAWIFLFIFIATLFFRSTLGHRLCHSLVLLGQEHQHIE